MKNKVNLHLYVIYMVGFTQRGQKKHCFSMYTRKQASSFKSITIWRPDVPTRENREVVIAWEGVGRERDGPIWR